MICFQFNLQAGMWDGKSECLLFSILLMSWFLTHLKALQNVHKSMKSSERRSQLQCRLMKFWS